MDFRESTFPGTWVNKGKKKGRGPELELGPRCVLVLFSAESLDDP
jgi:hypothetical protein